MKNFFKNDLQVSNASIQESGLDFFRYSLLSTITLTAFIFSFFIATLYTLEFFPLNKLFQNILYFYSLINLFAYYLLQMNHYKYYLTSVNILILSSLSTFIVMALTVTYDEFRFVWFFLTSFASFILGGKRYGFMISFMIVFIMMSLYFMERIELSAYAMFTFIMALFVFNIFSYFFIQKIENDAALLQQKVIQEVVKRQTQEQLLLRQYRMTNMGEMIDAIAHQWRQPLMQTNMILLNIDDALDDDTFAKEYMQEKIAELTSLTAHMSQTIEDFRDLLRDDKDKTEFQITDALEEVFGFMKNHLKDIHVDYNKNEISIINYKNELIQVLIILLSNAAEAFEAKKIDPKYIAISIQTDQDNLSIAIEDNAGGIESQFIDKLFDPYFTTKKQSGGTGLGLYIAKIIIEQNMQGKLTVAQGDQGARFTITIKRNI
ncbi:MAG: GHKL domain-containing protein [Sulfurovum sp.]|nr:MAG: GHKL domain-containing protein [Sulfurovum sp.]